MINCNENENDKESRSHRQDINRPKLRDRGKYAKYSMSCQNNACM